MFDGIEMEFKLKFVAYQYFKTDPDIQLGLSTHLHKQLLLIRSGDLSVTSVKKKKEQAEFDSSQTGNDFLCASVVQEMLQEFQVHSDSYAQISTSSHPATSNQNFFSRS